MAIISTIPLASKYFPDNEIYKMIFQYFQMCLTDNSQENNRINTLPIGSFDRYYLSDDIFAIEQVFKTKDRTECFIESHKKYIDFQLILSGQEQMEYIDINKLVTDKNYDEVKDLIIYQFVDNTSKILLSKADIAIFFPEDGHIGLPKYKNEELVRKTVIKLPIHYFNEGK